MKYLVIPDVHEEFSRLQRALEHRHRVDRVIFLGDFFDSFNGITEDTRNTAEWLSIATENPQYIFLWGNHDVQYAFPHRRELRCSGYEANRFYLLHEYLSKKHWENFRLCFQVGKKLFSHAGLSKNYWVDQHTLYTDVNTAEEGIWSSAPLHTFFHAGYARGGNAPYGGFTWLDWNQEFEPIPGINQIVGHTKGSEVRVKHGDDSVNYCLDTGLQHVGILDEEEQLEVIEI